MNVSGLQNSERLSTNQQPSLNVNDSCGSLERMREKINSLPLASEKGNVGAINNPTTDLSDSLSQLALDVSNSSAVKGLASAPENQLTESELNALSNRIQNTCLSSYEIGNLEFSRIPRDAKIYEKLPMEFYTIVYGKIFEECGKMTDVERFFMKDALYYIAELGDQEVRNILNNPNPESPIDVTTRKMIEEALSMSLEDREAMWNATCGHYKVNKEELSTKSKADLFKAASLMEMHEIYQARMEKDPVQTLIDRYEDLKFSFQTLESLKEQEISLGRVDSSSFLNLKKKFEGIQRLRKEVEDHFKSNRLTEDQYNPLMSQIKGVEDRIFPYAYIATGWRYN